MEKQRYRAKVERPRINYIPKVQSVDYEEEYSKYLMQEVSFEPRDNDGFMALLRLLERCHKKSIPQILEKNRPDAAYAIAMALCKLTVSANWYSIAIKPWWKLSRYGTTRRNARRYAAISKRQQDNTPNHRGMKKKLMDLMPETPFEGEPMAVIREPNDMEKSLL